MDLYQEPTYLPRLIKISSKESYDHLSFGVLRYRNVGLLQGQVLCTWLPRLLVPEFVCYAYAAILIMTKMVHIQAKRQILRLKSSQRAICRFSLSLPACGAICGLYHLQRVFQSH